MKEERQRLRLFVCMKTRTDGRSCCAHQGASIVLDELRRQILQRGETCSHIDVRPSGCLDRCEDGPVVMAFYGQLRKKQLRAESLSRRAWMMPHTHLGRFPPPTSQRFSTPF